MNILISACLMGVNCRYDGVGMWIEHLDELMKKYHLIPVCPEIFGGMSTPREPAERIKDKVITRIGEDVTEYYKKGAQEVLNLAKLYQCEYAILKERSPSCGCGKIYDGTFTHTQIDGDGVLAELLISEGIKVLGESNVQELL
ncbi:DUF523 domain-containing protein [Lachnospiraceae bacterium MD1]|jgi:uncharacterized protein YbbK (DUF523 family)|uniref:DUF523 domain-containing protein n=1 Tax=Variimorphobacter saccharofermentans TaxID=2755051 RepID=A0A839K0A3_9FIRM|nr:DUF523 domain-containing protein [Variimorphobacter saccharofermentans]MBB2183345.1 DUF523 domain-containing protein [Variimorphobacter saccharofermentans]